MTPADLPFIAAKIRDFDRRATIVIHPSFLRIRKGLFTGAEVRISDSIKNKVDVIARIPIDDQATNIISTASFLSGLLCVFGAKMLVSYGQQDLNSVDHSSSRDVAILRGGVYLAIGAFAGGSIIGGIVAAIATTLLSPGSDGKARNRQWAKDLENHLNRVL